MMIFKTGVENTFSSPNGEPYPIPTRTEPLRALETKILHLLSGIDRDETSSLGGWWETSSGARFGASILVRIRAMFDEAATAAPAPPAPHEEVVGAPRIDGDRVVCPGCRATLYRIQKRTAPRFVLRDDDEEAAPHVPVREDKLANWDDATLPYPIYRGPFGEDLDD